MADNMQAPTGAMVAAFPDDPESLALEGFLPAETLHVSLVYMGDASTVPEEIRGDVHRLAAAVAADFLPFDATVDGIAEFGPGTEDACAVLLVSSPVFADLRDAFMAQLPEMMALPTDERPHFVPHITLGYGADPGALEGYAGRTIPFSKIGVAFAEEVGMHGLGDTAADGSVELAVPTDSEAPTGGAPMAESDAPIEDFEVTEDGRWQGVLVIEGVESGDGRLIAEGALSWRELPLPLMGMFRNPEGGEGHDGALLIGSIDNIVRDGRVIKAEGSYDMNSEAGAEAMRLGVENMLRGVSVDLDKVAIEWENEPPSADDDIGLQDLFDFDPGTMIVAEARIMGATLCPFPAFEEAYIEVLTAETEALVLAETVEAGCADCGEIVDPLAPPEEEDAVVWANTPFAIDGEVVPGMDVVFKDPVMPEVEHVGIVVYVEGDRADVELVGEDGSGTGVVVSLPVDMLRSPDSPVEDEPEEEEPDEIEDEMSLTASAGSPPMPGATMRFHRPVGGSMSALVASAAPVTLAPPVHPPAAWFALPENPKVEPVRFSKEGQVAGFVCTWDSCHIGFNHCVRPPRSASNYAKFRTGEVLTAEGTLVATGTLMMDTVHPSLKMKASDAQSFYAHTGSAAADLAVYETNDGIYVAGALRPNVNSAQVRVLRASDFSPDWRKMGHQMEMVGLLAVNTSGFIVDGLVASGGRHLTVTPRGRMVDGEMTSLVAAGMVTRETIVMTSLSRTVNRLSDRVESLEREVAPLRAKRAASLLNDRLGVRTSAQRQAAARETVERIAVR